jgi:hypothetical protein
VPTPPRLLLYGPAVVAGVLAGVLGSFVHTLRTAWLPGGLLCALALTGVVFVAAGLLVGARSGAATAAVGWFLPVLLLSAPRPEGDLGVAGNGLGYAWLVGGTIVAALTIAWPYGPRVASSGRGDGGR